MRDFSWKTSIVSCCWLPTLFYVYLVLLIFQSMPLWGHDYGIFGQCHPSTLLWCRWLEYCLCVCWSISLGSYKSSTLYKPNYLHPHSLPSKSKHRSLQSKSKKKFRIGDLHPLYLCVQIDTHIRKCIEGIYTSLWVCLMESLGICQWHPYPSIRQFPSTLKSFSLIFWIGWAIIWPP